MFKKSSIKNNIINLLTGRVATNIADSLFYMTILWFFKEKFHSPVVLSLIFMADSTIDMIAFLFGPLIDRVRIKKLLCNTSLIQLGLSLLAVIFFHINQLRIIAIILLTVIYVFLTIGSTLIYPAESKILPTIVKQNELAKVNGLFQMTYRTLDLFLDAAATLLITIFSFSWTMIISALFFAVALTFYQQLHLKETTSAIADNDSNNKYWHDLVVGWKTLKHEHHIFALILPFAITNLFYGIASVGLPYFSSHYLAHSAISYGSIELFSSIGGLISSIFVSKINPGKKKLPQLVTICLFLAGLSVVFEVSLARYSSILILVFVFSASFWIGLMNINFEVLVQESFDPQALGRISTINSSIINCMIPLGSLASGIIVKNMGANIAILTQGIAEIVTAVFYLIFFKNTR